MVLEPVLEEDFTTNHTFVSEQQLDRMYSEMKK